MFLSFVLLGVRFPWIWYRTGVSFWRSTFWTLRVTCLFLFLFWSRSLPLSKSDLTHYGCCVGVVKALCKLLVFDCHYCARYWKVPMPFHSHQVSFAFMWQKLCARVKPPCLFWYLLPFKARAIFIPILRAAKKPYWATLRSQHMGLVGRHPLKNNFSLC